MNVNDFEKIFNDINFNNDSILGYNKTKFIYEEIIEIKNHLHTAEVGVYKGYTSKLIATINSNNFHFCYDTFSGVVKYDELIDKVVDGSFSSSIEEVKELINLPNVIYKSGIFPETFQENNYRFSFVHSDTDTYFGAKATLDCFASVVVIGGKILFDDYKWELCPGIEKAVQEFISINNSYDFKEFENQCVLTKIK